MTAVIPEVDVVIIVQKITSMYDYVVWELRGHAEITCKLTVVDTGIDYKELAQYLVANRT